MRNENIADAVCCRSAADDDVFFGAFGRIEMDLVKCNQKSLECH